MIKTTDIRNIQRAFDARLAYEINCIAFYDRPNIQSFRPAPGWRISDFAKRYKTTVSEMVEILPAVEHHIKKYHE